MNYNKYNNIFGWATFLIASITYILTLEPSTSFWDCGEFIACIYRLQVAHQPGAPLFTMIGKVFSLLSMGDRNQVAYFTNMSSALASGATILFLFWTITALAKKMLVKAGEEISTTNLILIMASGTVGALAYAFSDTFWFSAVESEVYAQSSLCTAIVFWAILKWEAHADEPRADKWIVFIAYVMGLSIGIHLLNLLVIPAIALIIYFKRAKNVSTAGTILTFLLGVVTVAVILWGVIQFTVKGAAFSDLLFVNTFNMGFGSGAIVFFVLVIVTLAAGIYYTIKPTNAFLFISAGAFVVVLTMSAGIWGFIGSALVLAVLEYALNVRQKLAALNRVLICAVFILFGYSSFVMIIIRAKAGTNLNNSDPEDAFALNSYLNRDQYGETPLLYGEFFDSEVVSQKPGAILYRRGDTKYEQAGTKIITEYDRNTLFPRMFSQKPNHAQFYREWTHLGAQEHPTMGTNISFFLSWQISQMYTRYFLWNFAGRANDLDGQNNTIDGSWISGLNFGKHLPASVTKSNSYNRLYFLPLIIGLLGMVYHFKRNQRDAGVVVVLFFFTGLAIVLYLNQDPLQPRERDYAYAGSFYAFAIWIGLGVLMIAEFLSKKLNAKTGAIIAGVVCLLAAPVLMANQEWDDHDRSTKLTPHDMAYDYLNSCAPNAILFCFADNDTYPLWYIQEVEGVRPDVRIVNLSLLGTDWYIRQMKQKMNNSEPLPLTMSNDKFKMGVRDVIRYQEETKIAGTFELKEVFDFITSDNKANQLQYNDGQYANYMPTKSLKLTVDTNQVLKTGTVPAALKGQIASQLNFTYPGEYVTKDNLAIMDILAHNNWKRPIYFTVTAGNENMLGLDKYMYNEGFAYRLLPLKPDTTVSPLEATNTLVMYNNVVNKFRYGKLKTAKNLDNTSTTLFYPVITRMFVSLTDALVKEGHVDLAKNALKKFQDNLPDDISSPELAIRKYYLAQSAYAVGDGALGNHLVQLVYDYVVDQLAYNYIVYQKDANDVDVHSVQLSLSLLNSIKSLATGVNQPGWAKKAETQLNDYSNKFAALMQQGQQ